MAIASKVTTVVVTAIAVALIWLYVGQDAGRLIDFLKENWSTVALAVQIGVMFILACTKHYIVGGIVMVTSLATLFGVVL